MDAAGNVVLGKRKRTAAPKYVHDPELDQLLGEDSNDEMEEEDEEEEDEEEEEVEEEEEEDDRGQDVDREVWEPVPIIFLPKGAPEPLTRVLYEVSTLGRVRSRHRDTPHLRTPYMHQNRYHAYSLSNGGRSKTVLAHDLVLGTFKGPYPDPKHLWHIDHIDHDMYNNALSNLRYVKAKHNLSRSRKPCVRKGPSTAKPRAWSYVAPDSPDRLPWRQHPTLPELEVAKEGNVRWAAGYMPNGKKKRRMLTPLSVASGHLRVCWRADGRQCNGFVHRLVYRTWVGHFPTNESAVNGKMAERLVLDHKDNNKANNHADNLEFVSHMANSRKRAGRNTNNTSGVNSVSWRKDVRKWMAYIPVKSKRRIMGFFEDKRAAKKARLDAQKAYW